MKSVSHLLAALAAVAGVASIASGCAIQSGEPEEATGETSQAMCKTSPCGAPTCYPKTTIHCTSIHGSGYGLDTLGLLPQAGTAQWMTPESPFESDVQTLLGASEPGAISSWAADGGTYEAVGIAITAAEASNATLIGYVEGPGQTSWTEVVNGVDTTIQINAGIWECISTTTGVYRSIQNDCGGGGTSTSYVVDWDPHSVNN